MLTHWSVPSIAWGAALLVDGVTRMLCEERLLVQAHREHRDYAKATRRMIPYVF